MAMCTHFHLGMTITAKVTCVILLIIQSALLDYIIVKSDKAAPSTYVWPIMDTIIILFWILAMASSYWYSKRPQDMGVVGWKKKVLKAVMRELTFAHIYWLVYSIMLVAKVQRVFEFADKLIEGDPVLSITSFKIILSLAGIMFPLLAYSRDEGGLHEKYKFLLKQLGTSASLDILDSVMVLDILFTVYVDPKRNLYPSMENAINTFSSLCLLLPTVPLLALRLAATIDQSGKSKLFDLALVVNSALYLAIVNIPLLCIRLVLWARQDIDVSTFFIKNLMAIVKGVMDLSEEIKVIRSWCNQDAAADSTIDMSVRDRTLLINDDTDYKFI